MDKNIYELIIKHSDDKTILKMMTAHPALYKDENVWKRIIEYKYPSLLKQRRNLSWKNYALKIIQSVSLLKEKYNFPYIPVEKFNPIVFYKKINNIPEAKRWEFGLDCLFSYDSRNEDYTKILNNIVSNMQNISKPFFTTSFNTFMAKMPDNFFNREIEELTNQYIINSSKHKDLLSYCCYLGRVDLVYVLLHENQEYDYNNALNICLDTNQLNCFICILDFGLFFKDDDISIIDTDIRLTDGYTITNILLKSIQMNKIPFIEAILNRVEKFSENIRNALKLQIKIEPLTLKILREWVIKNKWIYM